MKKNPNLWKYIVAAVAGVAVIGIVVVGATGSYLEGRAFKVRTTDVGLKTAAPQVAVQTQPKVEESKLPAPPPNPPEDSVGGIQAVDVPDIPQFERCLSECELTIQINALQDQITNLEVLIAQLEQRAQSNESNIARALTAIGGFQYTSTMSRIDSLEQRSNSFEYSIGNLVTAIGGFQYTSTINALWSGIYSIGNALTAHTTAHNQGGYAPIYGVDY